MTKNPNFVFHPAAIFPSTTLRKPGAHSLASSQLRPRLSSVLDGLARRSDKVGFLEFIRGGV
ncbi:MAG: hypothetical protein LBB23_04410 [Rickettsiales bacterium]|nr:hypothetical protein [Rickettsiales bacterium]